MSDKEKLELMIKEQGDVVRKLKLAKEHKDKVSNVASCSFKHVAILISTFILFYVSLPIFVLLSGRSY